jgi:hypothetical protein
MASTGALQGGFGSNGSHVSFEIGGVTTATQQANVCNHITQDMIHKALNTIEDREQRVSQYFVLPLASI